MAGANLMEEIDCGSFFDHIDDLLEFPIDDIENVAGGKRGGGLGGDEFTSLLPQNSLNCELPGSDVVLYSANGNSASDLSHEVSVPYEDIIQLEWLSTFVEDSFSSGGLTIEKSHSASSTMDSNSENQSQISSPVSVLESSSVCTNGKTIPTNHEKCARSKSSRPVAFTARSSIQLISPAPSFAETPEQLPGPNAPSESECHLESGPLKKTAMPIFAEPQKMKKIKILPPSGSAKANQNQNENPNFNSVSQAVRKCLHCEITKTPQWRAGPMGPKTLCNACGVRYKSGRLFPEYRPAASPTFIPLLHSNSHKKVIEMRNKHNGEKPATVAPATMPSTAATITCLPELIPRNNLRACM